MKFTSRHDSSNGNSKINVIITTNLIMAGKDLQGNFSKTSHSFSCFLKLHGRENFENPSISTCLNSH